MTTRKRRAAAAGLATLTAAVLIGLAITPPIPQDPGYHRHTDIKDVDHFLRKSIF